MEATKKSKQEWKDTTLKKSTDRFPSRIDKLENTSGIEIDYLYTPEDLEGFNYNRQLGYPGEYPFTRGVQPTMYRGRLWTMRQYAGMADAEKSNQRYLYLLEKGQTGLSVAFDLPTQLGLDSTSCGKVRYFECANPDNGPAGNGAPYWCHEKLNP